MRAVQRASCELRAGKAQLCCQQPGWERDPVSQSVLHNQRSRGRWGWPITGGGGQCPANEGWSLTSTQSADGGPEPSWGGEVGWQQRSPAPGDREVPWLRSLRGLSQSLKIIRHFWLNNSTVSEIHETNCYPFMFTSPSWVVAVLSWII